MTINAIYSENSFKTTYRRFQLAQKGNPQKANTMLVANVYVQEANPKDIFFAQFAKNAPSSVRDGVTKKVQDEPIGKLRMGQLTELFGTNMDEVIKGMKTIQTVEEYQAFFESKDSNKPQRRIGGAPQAV